jgi:hypothetical protein
LIFTIAVLAGTSAGAMISGNSLRGWLLWGHVLTAGWFLAALAAASLTWAFRGLLVSPRRDQRRAVRAMETSVPDHGSGVNSAAIRLAGLCMLAAGLVTALTILLTMLPWLGTRDMRRLLELHRYSGLLLTLIAILHVILSAARRFRRRRVRPEPWTPPTVGST